MKKTLLEIYALLVCFVSISCFSITAGIGLYSVVKVFSPELTLNSWEYERHQSNDQFWEQHGPFAIPVDGEKPMVGESKLPKRPSEAELTQARKKSYADALVGHAENKVRPRDPQMAQDKARCAGNGPVLSKQCNAVLGHLRVSRRASPQAALDVVALARLASAACGLAGTHLIFRMAHLTLNKEAAYKRYYKHRLLRLFQRFCFSCTGE